MMTTHNGTPAPQQETEKPATICAPATPAGAALAIVRISGPQAHEILSQVFSKNVRLALPNTIHYGHIKDGEEMVDECMVAIFKAPHSYTGEDSAEISCHGSPYILARILSLLIDNGCRQAQPGEFTQRAFINGKMDLSQAEAVAELIASRNKATHQIAMSQLRGHLSSHLAQMRQQLLKLTSLLELELDFADHEDLLFADRTELLTLAQHIHAHISQLAHTFETAQALKQGIPVAIVGKTNVGKSTLLNALLKDERAIVSDIHGTTRDTVEDIIDINGITFRLIDTAGIRQTKDQIEQIGINRTYNAIRKATIVLWLVDEEPTDEETSDMRLRCNDKKLILIHNKTDARTHPLQENNSSHNKNHITTLHISAKTGQNIPLLEKAICQAASITDLSTDSIIITSARHYDALVRARQAIRSVIDGLKMQVGTEILSENLQLVISILSEITGGQITPSEVLQNIFKNFCVGK